MSIVRTAHNQRSLSSSLLNTNLALVSILKSLNRLEGCEITNAYSDTLSYPILSVNQSAVLSLHRTAIVLTIELFTRFRKSATFMRSICRLKFDHPALSFATHLWLRSSGSLLTLDLILLYHTTSSVQPQSAAFKAFILS